MYNTETTPGVYDLVAYKTYCLAVSHWIPSAGLAQAPIFREMFRHEEVDHNMCQVLKSEADVGNRRKCNKGLNAKANGNNSRVMVQTLAFFLLTCDWDIPNAKLPEEFDHTQRARLPIDGSVVELEFNEAFHHNIITILTYLLRIMDRTLAAYVLGITSIDDVKQDLSRNAPWLCFYKVFLARQYKYGNDFQKKGMVTNHPDRLRCDGVWFHLADYMQGINKR